MLRVHAVMVIDKAKEKIKGMGSNPIYLFLFRKIYIYIYILFFLLPPQKKHAPLFFLQSPHKKSLFLQKDTWGTVSIITVVFIIKMGKSSTRSPY